jgi:GNAT superfamily N-acetyltransferase
MTASRSARRVPMTVTFFEMTAKPSALPPPAPKGRHAFLKADMPTAHFYRYLYDSVGKNYLWVDRKKLTDQALAEIIQHPLNALYVLYVEGCPAGMAEIDLRNEGTANIGYFGLMPEFIGKRLGYFFLYQTCLTAWSRPIGRLTINTCTLDHPRALPLYQRMGFNAYAREERFVELP